MFDTKEFTFDVNCGDIKIYRSKKYFASESENEYYAEEFNKILPKEIVKKNIYRNVWLMNNIKWKSYFNLYYERFGFSICIDGFNVFLKKRQKTIYLYMIMNFNFFMMKMKWRTQKLCKRKESI